MPYSQLLPHDQVRREARRVCDNIGETICRLAARIAIAVCAASYLFAQPLSLAMRAPKPGDTVAEASTHVIRAM